MISHNTITHFHRMGMEIQTNTKNLEAAYNQISAPVYPWWLTFGISIAITGVDATVHDNVLNDQVQKACGSACWIGYGIEAWGVDTIIANNTIEGHWGNGVAIGPSQSLQVVDNTICGPEMSEPGNAYVVNQRNTAWSGEVIHGNAESKAMTCGQ